MAQTEGNRQFDMPGDVIRIPLFPLHTVLFPGGALPLRIFEPRYLDMVSESLRNNSPFGICLISEGEETGDPALVCQLGTLGEISYWQKLPNGMLGITVRGKQRFRVQSSEVLKNRLTMADVELIEDDVTAELPEKYRSLAAMLKEMIDNIGHPYTTLPKDYNNIVWLGYRLAELLPLASLQKQHLLEMTDPFDRMERINLIMAELELK